MIRATLLLVASVAFLLLIVVGAELLSRPKGKTIAATVDLHLTQAWDAVGKVDRVQVPLSSAPGYKYRHEPSQHPYGIFSIAFSPKTLNDDAALYLGWARGIREVRINGELLKSQSAKDFWGASGGFEPVVYLLPKEYINPDENLVTVLVGGNRTKILPIFYTGEPESLLRALGWGRVFSIELVVAAIAVMLFLALVCVMSDWPKNERPRIYAFVALLLIWSVRNLTFFGLDSILTGAALDAAHYTVTYVFLAGFAVLACTWTSAARSILMLIGLIVALSISGAWLVFFFLPPPMAFLLAFTYETVLTCVLALAFVARFLWYYARTGPAGTLQSFLFIVCMLSVLVDALDDQYDLSLSIVSPSLPLTFYIAPMCGLFLALGMSSVLVTHLSRARALIQGANTRLQTELDARRAELERVYAERRVRDKHRSQKEERERIMRDMHDGLGGRLTSLAAEAEDPDVSRPSLVTGLQDSLTDLRLIVDSLDTEGDSLPVALGAFRARVEPGLEAAGVRLNWQVDDSISGSFSADLILEIFRLLQEACSNVIHHSNATEVSLSFTVDAGDLILQLKDNGGGQVHSFQSRRGLNNMRKRADKLDATLSFVQCTPGVLVEIRFGPCTDAGPHRV